MIPEMNDKDVDIESVTQKILADEVLLSEILEGLVSKHETFRYNCHKVLMQLTEKNGELLYHYWDYLVELLDSQNSYRKMSAIHLISNLVKVDTEDRFEQIFDKYYSLLDDKSVIVAIYAAACSGRIVKAKPQLESQITSKLLNIDNTHHNEGRMMLVKTGAIQAFDEYFAFSTDKERILDFARASQYGSSPKTIKLAQDFLEKWLRTISNPMWAKSA